MAAQSNITVNVADTLAVRAALAEAAEAAETVAVQRRALLAAIRGSCACDSCKAALADLLSAP